MPSRGLRRCSSGPHPVIVCTAMAQGRLQGKVSIVTGAASGFGQGIAAKFVHEGSKVVIADVAHEAGQAVAQHLGCRFVRADVTSKSDWERLLAETLDEFGHVDVVNNAGVAYSNKATEDVTEDEFDLVFRVNIKSMFLSTAVLLPYFLKENRPGCFVQVASTGGVRPRPRLTWYNATKGALITATKGMAVEYGPRAIRFNAVSPVVGNTAMSASTSAVRGALFAKTGQDTLVLGQARDPREPRTLSRDGASRSPFGARRRGECLLSRQRRSLPHHRRQPRGGRGALCVNSGIMTRQRAYTRESRLWSLDSHFILASCLPGSARCLSAVATRNKMPVWAPGPLLA